MLKTGFIGTGNMGGALARAAAKGAAELLLSNRSPEKALKLMEETGGRLSTNREIAAEADYIFLGVKPQMLEGVLSEIRDTLKTRESPYVLVSMAAAFTIERIRGVLGFDCPIIRIMPNTPAAIGEGMILYAASENVTRSELERFLEAMSAAGRFSELSEGLINAGSSVAGCGPAFADLFIEALADGGVACGLPRAKATEYAAQMLLGSARLILESGKHPGELKDAVCSPGGTTIQGVRRLEEGGFRAAVINAVIAAYEKNFEL